MVRVGFLVCLVSVLAGVPAPGPALDLDRRRMLTIAEHEPWRGVGRVNVATFDEQGMCTGTLVDEDLVITAAHCLYSERSGKLHAPGNVHFVAGWRRGQKVASRGAAALIIHPDYRHGARADAEQIAADLALIRLETPIPMGDALPFPVAEGALGTTPLTLISYRRDRPHALTRQDGCALRGADKRMLVLNCDVTFGASGSPVFIESNGARRIVGVISAKGVDSRSSRPLAFAARIDLDRLKGLRAERPGPS